MKNICVSREHALYLRALKRKKLIINLIRLGILGGILIIWELLAAFNLVDSFITSSPSRIAKTIADLYINGNLFYHISITLIETIVGFLVAVILGYVIAVALWSSDYIKSIIEPYIVVLNALPKIALGPLIIIWMGTGYTAIIFMTVIVCVIVCIMNTLTSFLQVDTTKITLMKAMGASKIVTLTKLIIPASLPSLMNTLKVAVGLAWIGSVMGEYIVSRAGLGYLIVYGGQVFKLDLVMASTLILCVLAGSMYAIVALLERLLCKKFYNL